MHTKYQKCSVTHQQLEIDAYWMVALYRIPFNNLDCDSAINKKAPKGSVTATPRLVFGRSEVQEEETIHNQYGSLSIITVFPEVSFCGLCSYAHWIATIVHVKHTTF